jgi:hypothetical protein
MIKEITLKEVRTRLEEWGYEFTGHTDVPEKLVTFQVDSLEMCATYEDVMDAEGIRELEAVAEWYSCCGDVLDHDVPMCPSCKEWCR